jgi:hypothetical protein
VTVASLSVTGGFFNSAGTDSDGRFRLPLRELPDSTRFMVSVEPRRGMMRLDLNIDRASFPARTLWVAPPVPVERMQFAHYADKAEQQYLYEGGTRITLLSAAVVSARRTPPKKSQYYTSADNSLTERELERVHTTDIVHLLQRFSGVQATRTSESVNVPLSILIRGVSTLQIFGDEKTGAEIPPPPLILVNDIPVDIFYLNMINVSDIAQIDILKNPDKISIFGVRGSSGVISIYTKRGENILETSSEPFNIKITAPLGYQQPVEFYAPKYDSPAKRNASAPDLRTTIHWQPVVKTSSLGVASFEFYTADEHTSYTVSIEGLAEDGTIIRYEGKVWQKN